MSDRVKSGLRKARRLRTAYYVLQFRSIKRNVGAEAVRRNDKLLREMRNTTKADRCFIIGNGPSLKVSDLESLGNEVTFASNGIYHLFEETRWRPNYYFVQDSIAFDSVAERISGFLNDVDAVFVSMNFADKFPESLRLSDKLRIMYIRFCPPNKRRYRFSEDLTKEVFEGLSVTYSMMQTAIYLGYKKIYLIGVDHSYAIEVDREGNVLKKNENQSDHFYSSSKGGDVGFPSKVEEITCAYTSAMEYAKKSGVEILNATRGGKLEVFPRVGLDALLQRESIKTR